MANQLPEGQRKPARRRARLGIHCPRRVGAVSGGAPGRGHAEAGSCPSRAAGDASAGTAASRAFGRRSGGSRPGGRAGKGEETSPSAGGGGTRPGGCEVIERRTGGSAGAAGARPPPGGDGPNRGGRGGVASVRGRLAAS